MKPALIILVLAILTILPATAADFYVSTAGSDSNPGTSAQPFATIQHAVDVAPAEMTYIHLDASHWTESVGILDKDISITGSYNGPHGMGGRDRTFILGGIQSHTVGIPPMTSAPILIVSDLNAYYVDHVMPVGSPMQPETSFVTNCDISNPSGHGINGWYLNVSSCAVHDCSGYGIICTRGSATGNTVFNNNGSGIALGSTGWGGSASNNTIYNNTGNGIAGTCFPALVIGNTCYGNGNSGISVNVGPVGGNGFTNNHCYSNGSYGISIGSMLGGFSSVNVSNNTCSDNNYGIYCGFSGTLSMANNIVGIDGNMPGNQNYGISIGGDCYSTIDGNTVLGNGDTGIIMDNSDIAENIILSNNLINNNNGYGLQINTSAGVKILGNSMTGNTSYGVYLNNSTSQADLGGGILGSTGNNTIIGNGTYELYKTGTNNIYAKNNHWDNATESQMASGFQKKTNIVRFYDAFDYWQTGDPLRGAFIWKSDFPRNGVLDFAANRMNRAQVSSLGQIKANYR